MGSPKALLPLREATFLEVACRIFDRPGVSAVVAVLGADAERVRERCVVPAGTSLVVNEHWHEGMLGSVWAGLDAAEAIGADAILLHPVDNPFVAPATVDAVAAALAAGAQIAVPSHGGRRGHPAGFSRAVWPELRAAPVGAGARAVLASRPERVVHVPAGADCLVDVDTPDDLPRDDRRRRPFGL